VSSVFAGWDDDELFASLREAVRARRAVPPEFVEAAKSAFAWHNIDAELAQLTYDSSRDLMYEPSLRAEAAPIRALTFTSPQLTIELEVSEDSLIGQLIPAQRGTVRVVPAHGTDTTVPADEIGCFAIRPIPSRPFRLCCQTADGTNALTGWITL
jgi:hypothetical protein